MRSVSPANYQGFILVISTLIIAAVMSLILIKTMLSAITQVATVNTKLSGAVTQTLGESCANEALIRLNRDNTYSGGPMTLGADQCAVAVSGAGNSRTLIITANKNGFYASTTIAVTLAPFTVTSWDN